MLQTLYPVAMHTPGEAAQKRCLADHFIFYPMPLEGHDFLLEGPIHAFIALKWGGCLIL